VPKQLPPLPVVREKVAGWKSPPILEHYVENSSRVERIRLPAFRA